MEKTIWSHLPLLVQANSKESVEYILEALWRTRKTGLHSSDRQRICDMLQLHNASDLDPLLVCLRMLIRKCVYGNLSKDDIQKLFPSEVLPELQRLLTLLLQKFQKEWQEDILQDTVPNLKEMSCNIEKNQVAESADHTAVVNLKLKNVQKSHEGDTEVKFQLDRDSIETMLKSLSCIRDQFSETGEASNSQVPQEVSMEKLI